MDFLPIQASAVPCERVFSSAKETMTAQRSRISPELMTALQILKFSKKNQTTLTFTNGFDWGEEMQELEEACTCPPENLDSFINIKK